MGWRGGVDREPVLWLRGCSALTGIVTEDIHPIFRINFGSGILPAFSSRAKIKFACHLGGGTDFGNGSVFAHLVATSEVSLHAGIRRDYLLGNFYFKFIPLLDRPVLVLNSLRFRISFYFYFFIFVFLMLLLLLLSE